MNRYEYSLVNFPTGYFSLYMSWFRTLMGTEGAGEDATRDIFTVVPEGFYFILGRGDFPLSIAGIVCLVAVTLDTANKLRDGAIIGSEFSKSNVLPFKGSHGFYYLGAVGAVGIRAKAIASSLVAEKILELASGKECTFFARPINEHGLRFLRRLRFQPIDYSSRRTIGGVYYLNSTFLGVGSHE